MGELQGKSCVITGAATGIGAATARLFASEGGSVLITDVLDEKGEALAGEIGAPAAFLHADVAIEKDVQAAVAAAVDRFGRIDVMFNNAGVTGVHRPIAEISSEAFDQAVGILLRGVFFGMKHAAAVMKAQGSGAIINTASVAGVTAGYGPHIYSAAKAAVIQLTRSVANELAGAGIRVNCVCPGAVATPIFGKSLGLSQEEAEKKLPLLNAALAGAVPLRRSGRPEDVARAVLWLAGDVASFVTGQALILDGGFTNGQSWTDMESSLSRLRNVMGIEE